MFTRWTTWVFLLGFGGPIPAWADIYAYVAEDGSVSLTNVPADARFNLLLRESGQPAAAGTSEAPRPGDEGRPRFEAEIQEASRAHGVETALLHAVVSVESRYNPRAVSNKGAIGLMQLMPQTARRYGVQDAFDPRQNLHGGARYLRDLLRMFDNDVSLALAAYNAGEQAVVKHGNRIPPFQETKRYVPMVLELYRRLRAEP